MDREWDLSLRVSERYLWALSVTHIIRRPASKVNNELVEGCCIMERVKRLAGNEIELGLKIPTIEPRASIPIDKGNYVCCHNGSTDKYLRRICRTNMGIQFPLFVIDQRGVSVMST